MTHTGNMSFARLQRLPFMHRLDLPDPTQPHETRASTLLRPIVFGANDGLVSNLALVMGIAGANAAPGIIVLAGIAGLLAGAFSMGVGEYISVQSQRELLEFQLAFQRHQLREAPEQERRILTEIYRKRGFTDAEAVHFVDRVFANPDSATRLLIFEEVGLDERSIGSPWSAGIGSFLAFTSGALVPLVPYLLASGTLAFTASLLVSLGALFLLGLSISRLTRRNPLRTALRQLVLGGTAAAATFAVGAFVGVRV
jgi:vacuolar iron transporter family protein